MAVIKTSKNRGRRGRPPKNDPQTQWTIRVPSSIAEQWNMILYDPLARVAKELTDMEDENQQAPRDP